MKKRINKYYHENGTLKTEMHIFDYQYHRINKPAIREWYPSGELKYIAYFQKGNLHKLNGYACIEYDKSGKVIYNLYYIDGNLYNESNYYKELYRRGLITENECFLKVI